MSGKAAATVPAAALADAAGGSTGQPDAICRPNPALASASRCANPPEQQGDSPHDDRPASEEAGPPPGQAYGERRTGAGWQSRDRVGAGSNDHNDNTAEGSNRGGVGRDGERVRTPAVAEEAGAYPEPGKRPPRLGRRRRARAATATTPPASCRRHPRARQRERRRRTAPAGAATAIGPAPTLLL